jgi:hypothetical protein
MQKSRCHLILWSRATHLSQLLTGFAELARKGAVELTQELRPSPPARRETLAHLRTAHLDHMEVVVDGARRLYFDTHDSWELDPQGLERCDVYFKRSFAPARIDPAVRHKVLPLGLYYQVYPSGYDKLEAKRAFYYGRGMRGGVKAMALYASAAISGRGRRQHTIESLSAAPVLDEDPQAVFMTRVYGPAKDEGGVRNPLHEPTIVNPMRADCVLHLRRELGDKFCGGIEHSPYAQQHFPEALLADNADSARSRYFNLLRKYSICVTTTGLHGSIGGKLAEYVAFAKAIVTEPLNYEVPGNFREGHNYLTFTSPAECARQVSRLMQDWKLRHSMMQNNWNYYRSFLRPDKLVRNALAAATVRDADEAVRSATAA